MGCASPGIEVKIVKIGQKKKKNVKSKKKKLNHKKKFFFALKSFLNDSKAILRKKNFFRFFLMGKICLVKKKKKRLKIFKNAKKNAKNVNFFQIFKGKFFPWEKIEKIFWFNFFFFFDLRFL